MFLSHCSYIVFAAGDEAEEIKKELEEKMGKDELLQRQMSRSSVRRKSVSATTCC